MNPIGWCDITINPLVGCSHCSPGCDNCYAEKFAARLAKNTKTAKKYAGVVDEHGKWTGKINEEGWGCFDTLSKSPKRVFLGSMTDIFHENVPESTISDIFFNIEYMWEQHTFLLLTKRPQNAKKLIEVYPLPKNVWLGVTVCNQQEADEKIPVLLQIPAAKRFVSIEPMLGPVNLTPHIFSEPDGEFRTHKGKRQMRCAKPEDGGLHWVICGGETGTGARPMHPNWVRFLRDQCQKADVPFFFKSWGDWLPCSQVSDDFDDSRYPVGDIGNDGIFIPPPILEIPLRNGVCTEDTIHVGKKRAGHLLDGRKWNETPGAYHGPVF